VLDAVSTVVGRVGEALDRGVEFVVGGGDRKACVGVPVVGRCKGCGVNQDVGVVEIGADPEEGSVVLALVVPFGEVFGE
jgi:hypothetical protein